MRRHASFSAATEALCTKRSRRPKLNPRSSRSRSGRKPAVIAAYHFGYGIGSILGAWDALRLDRGRERFARLTR